jgi:hypothetical protein
MNKYFDSFRRLTCDVKNPTYDKRKRYGADAIAVLRQGKALYEFTRDENDRYAVGSIHFYQGEASDSVYTSNGFGRALLENSVACEPETWRERVRLAVGKERSSDIIDQLIDSGVITPEQVEQAARDADQD